VPDTQYSAAVALRTLVKRFAVGDTRFVFHDFAAAAVRYKQHVRHEFGCHLEQSGPVWNPSSARQVRRDAALR